MLKRLPMIALGSAIALSACTQTPNTPASKQQLPSQYRIQQQDNEGASDASLDAIIRELDAGGDDEDQMATPSATPAPMQQQSLGGFRTQQQYGGGDRQDGGGSGQYGWYGGYGYGPYGYGIYARCQRIYRRCLSRAYYYYSGPNTYQFCRRVRNRCVSSRWWS